ncbi:MAG TPA: tetratricopeptide repeat protein [Blastocatellia bacterium]|nr:tetratricopeptide repeat protein [Blastocatellia bacterium]
MVSKKKQQKHHRAATPADLLASAQTHLQQGRIDEALRELRQAETQLRPRITIAGKKVSTPPHLLAAQAAFPALMARALTARARRATDAKQQRQDLEEAVQLAPDEPRYRVALGAAHLLAGDVQAASAAFTAALQLRPGDDLTRRARVVEGLRQLETHEADELLAQPPTAHWQRLAALRALLTGSVPQEPPLFSGLAQLIAGNHERAQATLGELPMLTGNPSRGEAAQLATQFFYSGALHFTAQRFSAALSDWREAERLCAEHQFTLPWCERLVAYYHKTAEALVTENLPLSLECWDKVLQRHPDDKVAAANLTAAKQTLAYSAWRAGDIEQAALLWVDALRAQPHNETLLKNLGIAYEKLELRSHAVSYWRELAKRWRQQSKQHAGDAAIKERLLKLEEHLVKLMLAAGESPQSVVLELEAALKFDPDNRALRLLITEQLMELGRGAPALKHLETMEKQHGVTADLLVRKSQALDLLHRRKEAQQALERALEMEPDNAVVRQSYLLFLGKEAKQADERGELKRAQELCEKQLATDPNYDPAIIHLASLYFEQNRTAEARDLLARAAALTPQTAQRLVMIGGVYIEHDQIKEAEAVFQQAHALDSSEICSFMIGMAYWEAEADKPALKYFAQAAETGSLELVLEIAMCLSEAGKQKEAERYFKRAMEIDPTHPLPHLIKAIAIMGMGDPLALLLGPKQKNIAAAEKELAEAERLMEGRPEFAATLAEIRQLTRAFTEGPAGGLGGLLGGGAEGFGLPPFLFEDDDDFDEGGLDFLFGPPKKKKKKK